MVVTDAAGAPIRFERSSDPQVSFVIVSFGHGEVLIEALTHLADDLAGASIAADVVLVDQPHPELGHASSDAVARCTSGVVVHRVADNSGFAAGTNLGVAISAAPVICLHNPDVLLEPGQAAALLAAHRADPDAIVVPRLVNRDGSTQERGWRVIHDGWTRPILDDDEFDADYGSAACWVLSRRTWDDVGGFDPGFFPAYYEDVDFALRAAERGHPTRIVDDIAVIHEWSVNVRGGPPEVAAQRRRFVDKWADLVADRAGE